MPDRRRRRCRVCGKHDSEVGAISWRGKCLGCATAIVAENLTGLCRHEGEALARWRRGMAASVGGVLLDELAPDPQDSSGDV